MFFFVLRLRRPLSSTLFPYTTLFRSRAVSVWLAEFARSALVCPRCNLARIGRPVSRNVALLAGLGTIRPMIWTTYPSERSEEHTSELQSRENLVCRLLLEKKKKKKEQ